MSTIDTGSLSNASQTLGSQSSLLGGSTGMFKMPDGMDTGSTPSLAGLTGIQSGMSLPQQQIGSSGMFSMPSASNPGLAKAALATGMSLSNLAGASQSGQGQGAGRGLGGLPAMTFSAPISPSSGATAGNPQLLAFLQSLKLGGGK